MIRRIALLSLTLVLSGCGFKTWWNPPFTTGYNPNMPVGDSENLLRARGEEPAEPILTTEPGDIWPGPLPPQPTLQDLVGGEGMTSQPELPVVGSPLSRGIEPPMPSPNPSKGSSSPPPPSQPGLPPLNPAPPLSSYSAPPARNPAGRVIQTPSGPSVTTGGGPGYQTTTSPNGAQSIIVPNGNGTSTVIHPDGRIETIPTPK